MRNCYKAYKNASLLLIGLEELACVAVFIYILWNYIIYYQRNNWRCFQAIDLNYSLCFVLSLIGIITNGLTLYGIHRERRVLIILWLVLHAIAIFVDAVILTRLLEVIFFIRYLDDGSIFILIYTIVLSLSYYICIYKLYEYYKRREDDESESSDGDMDFTTILYP